MPPSGPSAAYLAELRAWLERHKRYPPRARQRGVEGVAVVRFRIDSEGRVLESTLQSRSGDRDLDREALRMLKRAEPFPVPPDFSQPSLQVSVPVASRLR